MDGAIIDAGPKSTEKLTRGRMCHICSNAMTRTACNIKVTFMLRGYICFVKNVGFDSHKVTMKTIAQSPS